MESRKKIPRSTIIWSADVDVNSLENAIYEKALPVGTIIKIDQVFFERYDKAIIKFCESRGYPVFVDRKIIEIPEKALQIAEVYLNRKPFMLNVMAGACSTEKMLSENPREVEFLKRFADLCKQSGTKSCAVTVLTSKSENTVRGEFRRGADSQVLWYASLMADAGMTDIVCSPLEAKLLRGEPKFNGMSINTPGIRLPNTDVRDQQRISTPARALDAGADRLVIGSNLTDGEGPITERLRRNYDRLEKHLYEGGYEFTA